MISERAVAVNQPTIKERMRAVRAAMGPTRAALAAHEGLFCCRKDGLQLREPASPAHDASRPCTMCRVGDAKMGVARLGPPQGRAKQVTLGRCRLADADWAPRAQSRQIRSPSSIVVVHGPQTA